MQTNINTYGTKTSWDTVEILIVGAGTMGASLTQAYAQAGFEVGVIDVDESVLQTAQQKIDHELARAAQGGIFTSEQVTDIKARILPTTRYEIACSGKKLALVIETATENIEIKKKIFKTLDQLCHPGVVLASNSSSLDVNILAGVTQRPHQVVWMHYFYLPHKNRGGEFAGTDTASEESIAVAAKYMKLGGKVATPILSSRKGGAADIIFVALLLEATRMVSEGLPKSAIEAGARQAFSMPIGFLGLMDATGIPIGYFTMCIFSDSSRDDDPLFAVYRDFFQPTAQYKELTESFMAASDKKTVTWLRPEDLAEKPDEQLVKQLKERFQAVGFMTASEIVNAQVIALEEVDPLCKNAFLWRQGPFALMNQVGMSEVIRMVTEREQLAKKQGHHFPLPKLLVNQAEKGEPWKLRTSSVLYQTELEGSVARVTLCNPQNANALDSEVFSDLKDAFNRADGDDQVKVVLFDTAPIKTFIAGANVPGFIKNIEAGKHETIKEETAAWQQILCHEILGKEKPRIAIVDGSALGGGVETAMAFADDPNSLVLITDRTTYTLPETRLGIYPGMRGTCLLPKLVYQHTQDAELAVAISRYYILAGGTPTTSPRIIKYLGLADCLVAAKDRDVTAQMIAAAIIKNAGRCLNKEQLNRLDFPQVDDQLTLEEKEEIRLMRDLFLQEDLIPALYATGLGWRDTNLIGDQSALVQRIARRVALNSPHAVQVANQLIGLAMKGVLAGETIDEIATAELDHLVPTFKHHDALAGLTALMQRTFPAWERAFPF